MCGTADTSAQNVLSSSGTTKLPIYDFAHKVADRLVLSLFLTTLRPFKIQKNGPIFIKLETELLPSPSANFQKDLSKKLQKFFDGCLWGMVEKEDEAIRP